MPEPRSKETILRELIVRSRKAKYTTFMDEVDEKNIKLAISELEAGEIKEQRVVYSLEKEVGELFTTTGRDVWRLINFCDYPTVLFENLETKEKFGKPIGDIEIDQFKKLIPKEL